MRGRGRGRGRGGRGGRGGRRGGRGGSRGRSAPARSGSPEGDKVAAKDLDVSKDVKAFFMGNVTMEQHYAGQEENRLKYAAGMAVLRKNGVEVSQNGRVRALAAAWARHDHDLVDAFLQDRESFGLVEVLKAMTILDAGRQARILEKKIKRLECSDGKVLPKTKGKLKSDLDNLTALKPQHGSASGAVCKHVRRWVRKFTKDDLEFYALHFPTAPWKKLADICHFHPQKDFEALPWFLPFCFGAPAPEGTMVSRCRTLTADNVNDLIKEFPIPYAHLKDLKDKLTDESKGRLAMYEPKLDTVIWWYEELQCPEVDKVILQRIEDGHDITIPNGKLLERLLTLKMIRENISSSSYYYGNEQPEKRVADETKAPFFKHLLPLAQNKINQIKLTLESPVVVIGDASGSMEVAIRTSSIIAGLLTALCSAKLVFFNTETRDAPYLPTTIEEVLQLAVDTVANGGTAPAASLVPFYKNKEVVKTFIIVTDEEENCVADGDFFIGLYKKYYAEVYPAKLVFVSFLSHQHASGEMVSQLQNEGFKPLQFKLEGNRPDLTKLDKLFGLLSADTTSFDQEVQEMEINIKTKGLQTAFKTD